MCSGPFREAQGHSNLQTRTERRGHVDWKRGEVASRAIHFQQVYCCIAAARCIAPVLQPPPAPAPQKELYLKYLLGGLSWVLLGSTGLVLPAAAEFRPRGPGRASFGGRAPLVDTGRSIPHQHQSTKPDVDGTPYNPREHHRGNLAGGRKRRAAAQLRNSQPPARRDAQRVLSQHPPRDLPA